ncbi:MAG: PKD domain-containing protein [Planctomycetes bacterium]|nr:PKD domain-containing protein [Planctomycetota bacterium]
MTPEHKLGAVARLANLHFRLLAILAVVLAAPVALHAADARPRAPVSPTANDDVYGGQRNKTLTVDAANGVLANDTDPQDDSLTAILVSASPADTKGTLNFFSDGSFDFTPSDNTTYITTFTYKANDSTNDSNVATVVISISNNGKLPDAPVAVITADDTTVGTGVTVNFDGSGSTLGDGATLDHFIWKFGDGATSDTGWTNNTSHSYGADGLYISSLTVKDDLPLTSETVFLPILVSSGTTGDGRMYVKKAQFGISWSKHAGGVDADKFKISGVWNPAGFPADLTGLDVALFINGQNVATGATLDEKGKFASPAGSSPSFKIAFNAAKGTYSIAGSLLDLRGFLGVVDQTEEKTLPIAIQVVLGTVTVDNDDCIAQMDALYTSAKGKGAKASFTFGKNATATGTFVSLKTSGVENPDTGGHKISASGVIAGDLGTNIEPDGIGDIEVTIGGATKIVLSPSTDFIVTGTGVDTTITLVKGAVPELSKFTISNLKGKFQLATNELTGVGIDPAGGTLTEDNLDITIFIPAVDGDLTFFTSVELKRSDISSTKWKR